MSDATGEIHGAVWLYNIHPVAIKVAYIKSGARLYVRGDTLHPNRPRKALRLTPYSSVAEPIDGARALLP
jgi:hypothetical protein